MQPHPLNLFQHHREGYKEVRRAFYRVMKSNYGSAFQVRNDVHSALLAGESSVVISGYYCPHYVIKALCEYSGLVWTDSGIRWTEKVGFYEVVRNVYVSHIISG